MIWPTIGPYLNIIFAGPRNKLTDDPNKSIILNNIVIKRISNLKSKFKI